MKFPSIFALTDHAGAVRRVLASATKSGEVRSFGTAAVKSTLDRLEERSRRSLREVIVEVRDAVAARVRRSGNVSKLVRTMKLPRRPALRAAMGEMLRRAWDAGKRDALREIRDERRAVRDLKFDPNQPRFPKGDPRGGQWVDFYHGTAEEYAELIKAEGLTVQKDKRINSGSLYLGPRGNAVFVTTEVARAASYGRTVARSIAESRFPHVRWGDVTVGPNSGMEGVVPKPIAAAMRRRERMVDAAISAVVLHFRVPRSLAAQFRADSQSDASYWLPKKLDSKWLVGYRKLSVNWKRQDDPLPREKRLAEEGMEDLFVATGCFDEKAARTFADWDESKHPRAPSGTEEGGEWTSGLQRWAEEQVGFHDDGTVTILHGTNELSARMIEREGFRPGDPANVARAIEREYGLPEGSVLNHVAFQFPKRRTDLDRVFFTGDPRTALAYTIPEVLQDALRAAYSIKFPHDDNALWKDVAPKQNAWADREGRRLGAPAIVAARVPWEAVGNHAFGRQIGFEEYRRIGKGKLPHSMSIPISALKDAKITVRVRHLTVEEFAAWDESKHPRDPAGTDTGGQWTSAQGRHEVPESGDRPTLGAEDEFAPKGGEEYEVPEITHEVLRGAGEWGNSHSQSFEITGLAAERMGIGGYKVFGDSPRRYSNTAERMLTSINGDRAGSEEKLYHSFENTRHIQWKVGDEFRLPLTATAGEPRSYGLRSDVSDQKGKPTLFVFPSGTQMVGYAKWNKSDAKNFGHVWQEAIVAGGFRIKQIKRAVDPYAWQHDRSRGTAHAPEWDVVYVEQTSTFNPRTGRWTKR